MNLTTTAYEALLQNNYLKAANLYEEIIAENPEEIENYWYLGLCYLLHNQLEEAQTTWFLVFAQGDDRENETWTQDLIDVLEVQAQRLFAEEKYNETLLIRHEILEIAPKKVNNILYLVKISLLVNQFHIGYLVKWNLIDLLKESKLEDIELDLLEQVLDKILRIPHKFSIQLAESSLISSQNYPSLFYKIREIANNMGIDQEHSLYAIDVLEMLHKFKPNELIILRDLYLFYMKIKDYDNGIIVSKKISANSQFISEKLVGQTLLFNCYLTIGDWQEITTLGNEQKELFKKIVNEQISLSEYLAKESFIVGTMNLLYLQDKPLENHQIINGIAKLFQETNQVKNETLVYPNPISKKVLKIGYIAHTLRTHSVGFLSRWLINYHNSNLFKIYLYFVQDNADYVSKKWFIPKVNKTFMGTRNVNNLVREIQKDQIDILVDLDSLTLNLTCMVMGRKPAPIQVTWLGLDASGIPAIDYFIADPYVLPEDAQSYYQEKIWRLPQTYLAVDGFEIDTPILRRDDLDIATNSVVFINVQNPAKLNPHLLSLQMKIIEQVPNSYLLFKIRKDESRLKKLILTLATDHNLDHNRFRFLPYDETSENHRANLQIADVLLDTFPYNGATTTLEALWFGLPVVTKVGQQFAARNTYTFMKNLNIAEGIAWTDEEYVNWGVKLGLDADLRAEIIWKLKASRQTSPLWNGKQFTREMEKAYQQMWSKYVQDNS